MTPLPRIVEIKRFWDGREKRFECAVLRRRGPHLVVLFVAPAEMKVHGVVLPTGTVTFGHFWTDRPYNVYHWLDRASGDTLGYYCNISADTRIEGDVLSWQDLIVDVLISPAGAAALLDEEEIPADASASLRDQIRRSCDTILANQEALLKELDGHRLDLWPAYQAAEAREPPAGRDSSDDADA